MITTSKKIIKAFSKKSLPDFWVIAPKEEYYDAVDKCLGSVSEKMYELGYDNSDIVEREKYEKYLREKADLLEFLCFKRGIELWEK